jgi:hypothetical protein
MMSTDAVLKAHQARLIDQLEILPGFVGVPGDRNFCNRQRLQLRKQSDQGHLS